MSRKFTYADVHNWRVVNNQGKTLRYPKSHDKADKLMNDFKGFGDATRFTGPNAYAVRV
ncbi:hypothetical protein [Paenarthrobacter sp. NPDC018779]|uniref:hypothetical protein n=1 Tax=Paenarthrobacter sp. NPDC018779 TaxID=3364375 RepID=UPI0037C74286